MARHLLSLVACGLTLLCVFAVRCRFSPSLMANYLKAMGKGYGRAVGLFHSNARRDKEVVAAAFKAAAQREAAAMAKQPKRGELKGTHGDSDSECARYRYIMCKVFYQRRDLILGGVSSIYSLENFHYNKVCGVYGECGAHSLRFLWLSYDPLVMCVCLCVCVCCAKRSKKVEPTLSAALSTTCGRPLIRDVPTKGPVSSSERSTCNWWRRTASSPSSLTTQSWRAAPPTRRSTEYSIRAPSETLSSRWSRRCAPTSRPTTYVREAGTAPPVNRRRSSPQSAWCSDTILAVPVGSAAPNYLKVQIVTAPS